MNLAGATNLLDGRGNFRDLEGFSGSNWTASCCDGGAISKELVSRSSIAAACVDAVLRI